MNLKRGASMYLRISEVSKINDFVLDLITEHKLVGRDSTVVLTGSASIEGARASPNYERYFDGRSDIDLLIVLHNDISFLDNLFSNRILTLFQTGTISVLNYSYQYGQDRNAINIKYITVSTFNLWMNLKCLNFKSLRTRPLTLNKPSMKCYGINDYIIVPYHETKQEDFYLLHYNVVLDKNYYLLDIHSMLFFGTIIMTSCLFDKMHEFNNFFEELSKLSDLQLCHLFSYYLYDKRQFFESELRLLIRKFAAPNLKDVIDILKKGSVIETVLGTISDKVNIATVCWARSEPKEIFNLMMKISNQLSTNNFILLVDDMCPKVIYNRSESEQLLINEQYKQVFKNCKILFSSDIFKHANADNFVENFFEMMKRISLNHYLEFLPKKKQEKMVQLDLSELLHTYFELSLIEYAENFLNVDTMIFGRFSQNVIFLIKEQVMKKSELNFIIIPRFDACETNSIIL